MPPPKQFGRVRADINFLAGIIKFAGSAIVMWSRFIAAINATDATPFPESPSCLVSLYRVTPDRVRA